MEGRYIRVGDNGGRDNLFYFFNLDQMLMGEFYLFYIYIYILFFSLQPKCFCTALYDFEGQQEDDLSFQVGDEIEILENLGQDWLRGCLHGRKGLVPAAFVQIQPSNYFLLFSSLS